MSRTVRTIIYVAVIALVLAVVAPKVYADEPEVPVEEAEGGGLVIDMSADWFFDTATGVQYEGVADGTRCWEPDGTQGTTRLDPLTCETPAEAKYAEWEEAATPMETEEGATFDGGICWEADGTEGIPALDGSCVTPADYDAIYAVEVLAETPSIQDPNMSIAEVYGLDVTDPTPASDKPIGEGLVAVPFTFKEYVQAAHMPIAD